MNFPRPVHVFWDKLTQGDYTWTNMAWLLMDRVVRQGFGLFILILLARYLGPKDFGLLNYALAFTTLIWAISDLGMGTVAVRNLVRDATNSSGLLHTALILRILALLFCWATVFVGIHFFRPGDQLSQQLVLILATGMLFQFADVFSWWFESAVLSKYVVFARCASFLIFAVVKLLLMWSSASLLSFAVAAAGEMALTAGGIGIAYFLKQKAHSPFRFVPAMAKSLLKDSWPLMFSSLAIVIYMRIDQVMLGNMRGDKEVGIYSVVVMIAEAAYAIPMIVMPSLMPRIVAAKEKSESAFIGEINRLYRLMALLAYAAALPLIALSSWLITGLFGMSYLGGGPVLAVLAVGGIFTFMGVARSAYLVTMNWNKVHLLTVGTSCLLNFGLNFALIPHLGMLGAALASVASYWFAVHGICFLYRPLRPTGVMMTKALLFPKFW